MRVQLQLVLCPGITWKDRHGTNDYLSRPGPSGFVCFNFHGCLPYVEPWISLMTDPHLGYPPWRVQTFKYPRAMPADFYGNTEHVSKCPNTGRGPVTTLTLFLLALRDAIARTALIPPASPSTDGSHAGTGPALAALLAADASLTFEQWAAHAATAFGAPFPIPSHLHISVTMDVPVVTAGSVILWRTIHGNLSPYQADARAGKQHVQSRQCVSLIYDCVTEEVLTSQPGVAGAYKRFMQDFVAGRTSSVRSGSNQKQEFERQYFAARGTPPFPWASLSEAQLRYVSGPSAGGERGPLPSATLHSPLTSSHLAALRYDGYTVLTPQELFPAHLDPSGVELQGFMAHVAGALHELDDFFQFVVYERTGVPRPPPGVDPYQSIRSEADAAALCGNAKIMHTSRMEKAPPLPPGARRCASVFASLHLPAVQ